MAASLNYGREEQPAPSSSSLQRDSEKFPPPCRYKGVRKRKWGKYVSEIRLPNSRARIWLGSHDTAEKAARAFDAALFCLRGPGASFNFPDDPPDIAGGRNMSPAEIQAAAARYACEASGDSTRVDDPCHLSDPFIAHEGSPCPSVSDTAAQVGWEMSEMPLDSTMRDQFFTMETGNNSMSDFGIFPGFDDFAADFFVPAAPETHCWPEHDDDLFYPEASSSLWNF